MLAWWTVGSPVRELAVESWTGLPLRSFANTVQKPNKSDLLLQNLKKLQLDLLFDLKDSMYEKCFRERCASQIHSGLNSLQILFSRMSVEFETDLDQYKPMTPFQTILGTCQFPKLRSLSLNSLDSTMEELLTLLESSKQLQQLRLRHYELFTGTWEKAADWMRNSLALEEVSIDHLCGSWEPDSPVVEFNNGEYEDLFGHVQEFFSFNGPNPFSKEALAAQEKDLDEGREIYMY
ncbi:hypothetical protein IMSHALPRED_004350 [Imshaugia aleurites]|uniref:Uncharacterized protein n=1 Tax=Imshaugia aleurites TaxID=172621 RepID=A0A8H3J912_9LECA|nr:hypothetical protein IMSHALPRED_004350 [Imshaugia aleurites]